MRRRDFMSLIGAAATLSLVERAQAQQRPIPIIGILSPESATVPDVQGLREGLQALGYFEGQNIRYEYRWSNGNFKKLDGLADELVQLKVNVIVAYVTKASLAARKATATIPIVMVGTGDPVEAGLVASLGHPGGNVTGTSSLGAAVAAKQLGLLKDTVPNISRFAGLWNPANIAFQTLQVKEAKDAACALGVELQLYEAKAPNEFAASFAAIERDGIRALLVLLDPLFLNNFRALVELSMKGGLVTMTGHRTFAEAGGLMAYGTNFFDQYKRAAVYVDKILKGIKPADLPVEQATRFEFVINLKTAKMLGLTLPPGVLAIADEVIE
jgi:putative tryptophan/tyrosine transport system substrate-binding protein